MALSVTQAFGQEIADAVLAQLLPYIDRKLEEIVAKKGTAGKVTLSVKEITELTGLSATTIARKVDAGTFPAPIRNLDHGKKLWSKKEVVKYLNIKE